MGSSQKWATASNCSRMHSPPLSEARSSSQCGRVAAAAETEQMQAAEFSDTEDEPFVIEDVPTLPIEHLQTVEVRRKPSLGPPTDTSGPVRCKGPRVLHAQPGSW